MLRSICNKIIDTLGCSIFIGVLYILVYILFGLFFAIIYGESLTDRDNFVSIWIMGALLSSIPYGIAGFYFGSKHKTTKQVFSSGLLAILIERSIICFIRGTNFVDAIPFATDIYIFVWSILCLIILIGMYTWRNNYCLKKIS